MRKINTDQFRRGTRSTPREINRKIVLNLVREHQPLSRADLARRMQVARGALTTLVEDLVSAGVLCEGETADTPRGRKPTMLYVRTRDRFVVAVDVRFRRTSVMLSDFEARELALETFSTPAEPEALVAELVPRIRRLLRTHGVAECEGIGLVVPGMVDRRSGRILNSPPLGWKNVELRSMLADATGLRVFIENSPTACALAHLWLSPSHNVETDNFVYVAVSDGVGAGVVVDGELLRGHGETAGEFGHIPLSLDGPPCMCGLRGCWEAYTSNIATRARYLGLEASMPGNRETLREVGFTMADLIARARTGDEAAKRALEETGRYLGLGVANVITAFSPAQIVIGGEITRAWDLIGGVVEKAARQRALTDAAAGTPIIPAHGVEFPRLRGATALLVARHFAAPQVA
jgi:N-acetylglucosamine repressor